MKILYHLALPAGIVGICYHLGASPLWLVELIPVLAIIVACLTTALVAEKPRVVLRAMAFLVFARSPGGKKVANLLFFCGWIALSAASLLLLICSACYFAYPDMNPGLLGRILGSALLSPIYGIYLFAFVFYPFSVRARNSHAG
jgi:hypothetical protein